jgi:NAD(P)-dependent dehydrogenase (short-subunit alcohol dehydrogenase family)
MQIDLQGKRAVVTGAGQGIGFAVARALADAGAEVFGAARTVSPELKEITPHVHEADLATPEGPAGMIDAALALWGGIDILINNVGGGVAMASGFLEISDDVWSRTMELNLFSTVRATRAALPSLIESRGAVVNIGSVNARVPQPHLAHYSAAKAALTNLGCSLSEEFGPLGVRVNTVAPGPVRTRIWTRPEIAAKAGMTPEQFLAAAPAAAGMSTGAMVEADEVAALVLLLASDRLPSVTGSVYAIDGGMVKAL